MIKYKIRPMGKPRMLRGEGWKKRPCVLRYWDFVAKVEELKITLPEHSFHIHYIIKMTKSWSKKKKVLLLNQPHQQTPDKDNLDKALFDAVLKEDCGIYDCRSSKWWGDEDCIIIEEIAPPVNPMDRKIK